MTFDEFIATGRDVEDLGDVLQDDCLSETPGRVYADLFYITHWRDDRHGIAPPNGPTWLLPIDGDEIVGELAELEPQLFAWTLREGGLIDG